MKIRIVVSVCVLIVLGFVLSKPAYADPVSTEVTCADGTTVTAPKIGPTLDTQDFIAACGSRGYDGPGTPGGEPSDESSGESAGSSSDVGGTGSAELDDWLNKVVNLLSALVGLAIVVSLVVAGVQYITARDNANQVSAAKNRIMMAVLGFALFLMGYAFLQWLIPGGVF